MNEKTDPLSTVAVDPLVMRLRSMARHEHDDLSIGDEAADRIEQLEKRPSFNDEIENFHTFLGALSNLYTRMQAERDRLLVLATKHCPREHHDWQEILRIADDA